LSLGGVWERSSSDHTGQIWSGLISISLAAVLRWLVALCVEVMGTGISVNKPVVSSLSLLRPSHSWEEPVFILLVEFRWLEVDLWRIGTASLVNKLVEFPSLDAVSLLCLRRSCDVEMLPAGRGGVGKYQSEAVRCGDVYLPVGFGGEGECRRCSLPLSQTRKLQICGGAEVERFLAGRGGEEDLLCILLVAFDFCSLACRGGEGGWRSQAAAPMSIWCSTDHLLELERGWRCGLLSRRCRHGGGVRSEDGLSPRPAPAPPHAARRRAYHTTAWAAAAFFGRWNGQSKRQGGAIFNLLCGGPVRSTSSEFSPARCQVVRPRRHSGGWRRELYAGGMKQGMDCVSFLLSKVLCAKCQDVVVFLSLLQCPVCNMFPPFNI